jgi:hypothetical protein
MKLSRFVLLAFLLHPGWIRASERLKPFHTNGCTGFFNGSPSNPVLWRHCCAIHDLYFWAGGLRKFRKAADERLRDCVRSTGAEGTARLMYWGVRVGSWSPFKLSGERWGNGWLDGRSMFTPLNMEDATSIRESLTNHPAREIPPEAMSEFFHEIERQIQEPPGKAAGSASLSR